MLPLVSLLLAAAPANPQGATNSSPNVLLILSDDQGYGDVGCFGGDLRTPALDRLAREGARMTRFTVAAPVCTPSRYALLTGRHPLRAKGGLDQVGMMLDPAHAEHGLREGEVTLGEVLRGAGYRTGLIGKWHLGHGRPEQLPTRHGFDTFVGLAGGCVDYFTHRYGTVLDWYRGEELVEEEGYSTDLLTDAALDFLRDQDGEAPFLLVLSYNAPHYGKSLARDAGPATLATGTFGDPREDERTGEPVQLVNSLQAPPEWIARVGGIADEKRRTYAAMVSAMDDGIARVLDALDEQGLTSDTLVLFTPDHGADLTASSAGSNGPLRGGKHSLWEGGLRVPAILRWPGHVAPGSEITQLSSTLDVLPTLATITGADVSGLGLDGLDLGAAWTGGDRVERELVWRHGGRTAYRTGPHKLVGDALFDLDQDPGEAHDVAPDEPARVAELRGARDRRIAALRARDQAARARVERREGHLAVFDGDALVTEVRTDQRVPCLYPLAAPNGAWVTRAFPIEPDGRPGEEHDHPHHLSFWLAHGDVNGHDFWHDPATRIEEAAPVEIETAGHVALLRTHNRWVTKDATVLLEERDLRFTLEPDRRLIDVDLRLTPAAGPVTFGDTKEGTFALRMQPELRLTGKVAKGSARNSEGVTGKDVWGKRARWVAYSGPVAGQDVVLAMMDHPENLRHPTWWHARDYGLCAANPFGQGAFEGQEGSPGSFRLGEGDTLRLRYRVVLRAGALDVTALEQDWKSFGE
jgi:arylsulfatase A-like enzyme